MSARTLTADEEKALGLLDQPREIRISLAPDARPQMLTAKDMLDADVLRGIAINRRLALAALRLAVLAALGLPFAEHLEDDGPVGKLFLWLKTWRGDVPTSQLGDAIDEAVAALREAGEVSK